MNPKSCRWDRKREPELDPQIVLRQNIQMLVT